MKNWNFLTSSFAFNAMKLLLGVVREMRGEQHIICFLSRLVDPTVVRATLFKGIRVGHFRRLHPEKKMYRDVLNLWKRNFHHFLRANNKSFIIIFLPEKNSRPILSISLPLARCESYFGRFSFLFLSNWEFSPRLDEIWIVINKINARWKIKPHRGEIFTMFFSLLRSILQVHYEFQSFSFSIRPSREEKSLS